jgi:hypothetical protein
LIETVIAIILVTAFLAYLFTLPPGTSPDWRHIALALNTATVFGFLISWFRQAWNRLVFWATMTVLLLGHTATYFLVIGRIQEWPLAYYVALNPFELALFAPILRKVMSKSADRA